MSSNGPKRTFRHTQPMSAFGGTADRARLILAYPTKIRHFFQSIFPATTPGKTMGRPVERCGIFLWASPSGLDFRSPGLAKCGMGLPVIDRRAELYRRRAQELAEAARAEDDKGRRGFLIDKARSYWAVAEQIEPLLPAEPQVFRK